MTARPIRIALMSFAHGHAISYARLLSGRPGVELIATDPDSSHPDDHELRGAPLAASLGIRYLPTYQSALDWKPDAVIIGAENARHRDLAIAAADAGCHVLCEKPLATTIVDAEAMIKVCSDAQVTLMTAYPVRFAPPFLHLKRRIDQGEIGTLLGLFGSNTGTMPTSPRWFTDPQLAGGGALIDHVVHCADLFHVLIGEEPTTVYAATNKIINADSADVETGGIVTITYPNGVIATIDCTWSYPDDPRTWGGVTLSAAGTHGTIDIDPFQQRIAGQANGQGLWLKYGDDIDLAMINEFLDAITTGRTPQPDGTVGLATLKIVCAAQRSATTGEPVNLDGRHK